MRRKSLIVAGERLSDADEPLPPGLDDGAPDEIAEAILRYTYKDRACLWALEAGRWRPRAHTLRARSWMPLGTRDLQTFRSRFFIADTFFDGFAQTTTHDVLLLGYPPNGTRLQALEEQGLVEIAPDGLRKQSLSVVDDRIFVSEPEHLFALDDGAWRPWRLSLADSPLAVAAAPKKSPRGTATKRAKRPS